MESIQVTLVPATSFDYVKNLFQYYIYDMSEFTGWSPYANGTFNVEDSVSSLSDYWNKPDHFAYLIMVGEEVAGFSLIRIYPQRVNTFDMGQFFVLRKFKRQGIGQSAFKLSVQAHPGKWQIRILADNLGAKAFWNKAITEVATSEILRAVEIYKNNKMDFLYFEVKGN
ncbi:MAG: GNAT family N-acetyltransferase [Pseudomonadales bacterium]|nr:GNAT family N-acetyltransferase [Pseudomonadales bacterium]